MNKVVEFLNANPVQYFHQHFFAAALAGAQAFATHDALVTALEETCRAGDTLLFKGSHGMHMEQVLARLLKTKEHMGE